MPLTNRSVRKTNKQTNKQKQNKQTNKQTNTKYMKSVESDKKGARKWESQNFDVWEEIKYEIFLNIEDPQIHSWTISRYTRSLKKGKQEIGRTKGEGNWNKKVD